MALFGWKNEKRPVKKDLFYVLMDSNARELAHGLRVEAPGHKNLYIKLLDGSIDALQDAAILEAVPRDKEQLPVMVRLAGSHGDAVALEPVREPGAVRRNYRVPVSFDSYLYPPAGGRSSLHAINLSCGGLAFRSIRPMLIGERFQVVIPPVSEGPLLVWAELLRTREDPGRTTFYACKFIDLIDDEEHLLREAVFAIQVDIAHTGKKRHPDMVYQI